MQTREALAIIGFIATLAISVTLLAPHRTNAQISGLVQSGQQAVTGTAAVISGTGSGTMCVKALAGNMINVYLGPAGVTDSTGMELAAGNAYCAPVASINNFYVVASTTGASVSWIVAR